ncbi:hypothetical protein KBC79_07140, partial [Candidatus Woesebacteria bacterium]|nr:hypothetical protein [Candidatus Woesebacteria bacterium]
MNRLIGAHVSTSGGFDKAIERAAALGANCAQIFSGSPRVWARKPIASIDTKRLTTKMSELSIAPVITHSIYLINLVSENAELRQKSQTAVAYDLEFDAHIGGSGVVVHLGSHQGRGWEAVCEQLAEGLAEIVAGAPEESTLLIENSAGQNGKLCSDFGEIRWLIDRVSELHSERYHRPIGRKLGWCFDTCHGHAAGYYLGKNQPIIIPNAEVENIDKKAKKTKKENSKVTHQKGSAEAEISRNKLWESL